MSAYMGELDAVTGELTNIRHVACGNPKGNTVPVDAQPSVFGPYTYDPATRQAVPPGKPKLTLDEARTLVLSKGGAAPPEAIDAVAAEVARIEGK